MLFLDGHKSHISEECALYCRANDVILYGLNANSTHLLQPLDVGLFAALKQHWWTECLAFSRRKAEEGDYDRVYEVTVKIVPQIMKKVWEKLDDPKLIEKAFRKTGIFPWEVEAVDFTKLPPKMRAESNLQCSEDESDFGDTSDDEPNPATQQKRPAEKERRSHKFQPFKLTMAMGEDGRMSFEVPYEYHHDVNFKRQFEEMLKTNYPPTTKTVVSTKKKNFFEKKKKKIFRGNFPPSLLF